ncbi:cell division protein FtsA [Sinimarinibacterium sp. CAU 1509]|uniref:cell division protein FtsA n=1 Tax=Sinimarinibacterium sp. CAU 1509 TaxID=2562283 RepID=UPI0010AD12FE|nr:cell division protein FtsA [Sinimarinibacterium sp. CAU 1509]TJY65165.1 cell division protein FtsA [Sinimarinibacterium sp. CAU 1509]
MARREERNLLVGLDIGTSKCVAVVGQVTPEGQVEVVGRGEHVSRGMNRGDVVNIELTTQAIKRAVENAEHMANCRAQSVFVGISGTHIRSLNSTGVAPVRAGSVSERDVDSVMDAARAIAIPADQKILHVIPQEFVVDGREGIHDPIGMHGVRLEAKVHIVTGSISAAQNIHKCVESCGLKVDKLILQHLASSYATLLPDERDLGVCMVDIGGGTSDIAVFKGGTIRHTAVLPIAGNQVTNDISVAFRTPAPYAEEIKVKYGVALPEFAAGDDEIEVKGVGDQPPRRLSRLTLAEVIKPRYEELFRFIRKELHRSDWYDLIAGGVVLTGGSAQMPGVVELAEEIFELPVRLGTPHNVDGLKDVTRSPAYSTAVGLLLYGRSSKPQIAKAPTQGMGYWAQRVGDWFRGSF